MTLLFNRISCVLMLYVPVVVTDTAPDGSEHYRVIFVGADYQAATSLGGITASNVEFVTALVRVCCVLLDSRCWRMPRHCCACVRWCLQGKRCRVVNVNEVKCCA